MFIDLTEPEWEEFFPDTCSILVLTPTTNAAFEQVEGYAPLSDHTGLSCAIVHKAGKVVNGAGEPIGVSSHAIGLRGYFPDVESETRQLRASLGGIHYRVLSAGSDSQHVKTTLLVERTK